MLTCPYKPSNSSSFVEYLSSLSLRNREANATGFQSEPCRCSKQAPRPLCDASHRILVFKCLLKKLFRAMRAIDSFKSENAFSWASVQMNFASFFRMFLNGEHRKARLSMCFEKCWAPPSIDLSLVNVLGRSMANSASVLLNKGTAPLPSI